MAIFTWTPEFTVTEGEIGFKTLISKGESGRERRRSKASTARRTFKLAFKILTNTEIDAILAFYIARKGSYESFTWTHPRTAEVVNVRFLKDGLTRDWFTANSHKTGVEFQEIFTNEL